MTTSRLSLKSYKIFLLMQDWFRRIEVDRAVFFSLLHRGWMIATAPITLFLIASYLTPELQGFYYTFGSLVALQSFVELGFYVVVTQFASHEWAHLSINQNGEIQGSSEAGSRLFSLVRIVFKWYAVGSIVFIIAVGIAGNFFFSSNQHAFIQWRGPWTALVLITGVQLWLTPIISLLEGCNQVASINLFRFFQALSSNIALWTLLKLDQGLWISPASVAAGVLCSLVFLIKYYRRFFLSLLNFSRNLGISWKNEIWPMQWRMAISGLVNYFAFCLFNPVMFHYHGAVIAGQMGMTWQASFALGLLAQAWVQTKTPALGIFIAKKEYQLLDRLFFKISLTSLAVMTLLALAFWSVLCLLNYWNHPLALRFLPPLPTGLLLLATCLMQISQAEAAYLRAHKREVLMSLSIISSLTIGLLVWLVGRAVGPVGAISGYLAIVTLLIIPYQTWLWFRYRRLWHTL